MLQLTDANYFSTEAEQDYMSCSQYLDFMECEAKTMAKIRDEWIEESTTALKVGSYLHSHFEGPEAKKRFIADTPEMFLKAGGLKAEYKQADEMIKAIEGDGFCMYMLEGQPEVIITAELFGLWWKIKIDRYNSEKRRIADIKTTKSIFEHDWIERGGRNVKVSFVEVYNYPLRAAVYSEIERIASGREEMDWFDFYIIAVSKEDPPDKAVIKMTDPGRYLEELARIEGSLLRIKLLKQGICQPIRCEKCDYCRSTKVVERVIHYREL